MTNGPSPEPVYCDIELRLEGNELRASLQPIGGRREGDTFFCYLLRNGSIFQRGECWVQTTEFRWGLLESGLYSIQAHIKRDGINIFSSSSPILFLKQEDEAAFVDYESSEAGNPPNLIEAVFRSKYPYADFLLVDGDGQQNDKISTKCRAFAERHGMACQAIGEDRNGLLIADRIEGNSDRTYVFSGSCFTADRLVFGSRDLTDIETILRDEPVGNYTWLAACQKGGPISCGTDYFGIEKIYYIQGGGLALISNSYHLLLLLARDLDLPLRMDTEKAAATLVFATMQPFHQNFSHRMDVDPVQMLPADKIVDIHNGVITLRDSSLAVALAEPRPYDPLAYETLLLRAREEILGNVRAVLEHAAFEHVIADLSGGLDSRLVFCALTHFPEHAAKIRINSLYLAAQPNDLVVAQEVASFYDYAFDDLPRETISMGKGISNYYYSYNLGSYYSYAPPLVAVRIPGAARITGAYGEICARPYYARKMPGTEMDVPDPVEFTRRYLSRHRKSAISADPEGIAALHALFSDELTRIPGRTALEKFDNHYIFFRNGLHFSDRLRNTAGSLEFGTAGCPEFGPIQSKSLSAAKVMGYEVFASAKTQFDIINLLNPVIASLRYESAQDNADREAVRKKFGILGAPWSTNLHLTPRDVTEEWSAARKRIVNHDMIGDSAEQTELRNYQSFESDCFRMVPEFLRALRKNGVVSDDVVQPIWYMFKIADDKAFSRNVRWNITNRLASLYTQMMITKADWDLSFLASQHRSA